MTTEEFKLLRDELTATDAILARLVSVLTRKGLLTQDEAKYVIDVPGREPPKLTIVE